MDCREFTALIPAWLDGAENAALRETMGRHRSECAECARLLKIHEYIYATLETTEQVSAPAGLAGKILAAAAEEDVAVTVPVHRRFLMAISTAVFVMLGGALAGLAGFLVRSPRVLGISDSVSHNWTYLFEWPLLVKAWFLGLLTRQWIQMLVSPIHISPFDLTVPLFLAASYVLLLGGLSLFAWNYFRSPITYVRMAPSRSILSRY